MVRKIKKRKGSVRRTQRSAEKPPAAVSLPAHDLAKRPDRRHEFSISLCMIVKNESRLIAECLRSARGICKQMVVVDTGSDDNTAAIAAAEGAEVYHHAWPGHFSTARNISLEYATEDWILILDGDEVLDPDTLARLSPSHLNDTEHPAVEFEIVNYLSDEASIGNAHLQQQIRLFKRTEFHRYQGLIHNQLVDVRNGSALSASRVPVQVLHYGYTPTVWNAQNKAARLGMLEKALEDEPESLFCHYNLANHLKILERYERALTHYRACFGGPLAKEWIKMSFFSAAFCANQLGQHHQAIEICDLLLKHDDLIADAYLRKAEALLALGRPMDVVECVRSVIDNPRLYAFKQSAVEFALPYRLGRAYYETGQYADALSVFDTLSKTSLDPTVFTHLCLCALHCGRVDVARAAYHRGVEIAPNDPDWPSLKAVFIDNQLPL